MGLEGMEESHLGPTAIYPFRSDSAPASAVADLTEDGMWRGHCCILCQHGVMGLNVRIGPQI